MSFCDMYQIFDDLHYIYASVDSGVLCISLTCVKTFVAPDAFDVASLVIVIIAVIQISIGAMFSSISINHIHQICHRSRGAFRISFG